MEQEAKFLKVPVFFRRNRVWRVYEGGKLFHGLLGDEDRDSDKPEEWICSAVHAKNPGSVDETEGISVTEDGILFTDLLKQYPQQTLGNRKDLGVLVKFLDSAIRLPMQVHPTREFSQKNFGCPYGKAESWLILATRQNACIYFGFPEKCTKKELSEAVEKSENDWEIMTRFATRVPVKTGDVFFVPAGMIHAIGAGCLILETQEPTDFTISPEKWCGTSHLSEEKMYLGLGKDRALDCFRYDIFGEEALRLGRKTPRLVSDKNGVKTETLIGPEDTPCFSVTRHTLEKSAMPLCGKATVWVCTEGEGQITGDGYSRSIKAGNTFFLPAIADGTCRAETDTALTLVCCKGGE